MCRYLGIDYGAKRIGLAVGDTVISVAAPVETIEERSKERQVEEIIRVAGEYRIDELVMGLPLNMDGTEGTQAKATRAFGARLEKVIGKPIHYFDERLSSFAANELLGGVERSRKKKRRPIDSVAAQLMLQGFLESRQLPPRVPPC